MPEEFEEIQETTATPEIEPTPEVEAAEEPRVPVSVVKDLRDELRMAREAEMMTRQQMTNLMNEFQKMSNGQSNKAREMVAKLDPEIQEALEPYLSPVRSQLQETLNELNNTRQTLRKTEAERYIEKNIPNLNEIRGDLVNFLQGLPPDEQQVYAENPKALVRLAHAMFPAKKGQEAAKTAMRSMAKTETGVTPTRSQSSRPSEMSDEQRVKWMREHGWNV